MGAPYLLVGSTPDSADRAVRFEVSVVSSHRPCQQATIYLTKYDGRAIGDHSIGFDADMADHIAEMLRAAAAMCRLQTRN